MGKTDPQISPKKDQTPPSWTLHQVQGALANPTCPLLAVRASQLAQVYDVDQRSLKSQWVFSHPIEHWVWLDPGTLAVVTEEEVLHWSMQRTKPRHQFSRHERLWGMEVVGYQQDASCMWMALSALGLEQGQVVGLTQLYWRGGQLSQVIEVQAMALPHHRFSRNPQASAALLAAVRSNKERTGQFLSHMGVAAILTKHALFFLADVETAQVIHRIQLVRDILFATILDDKHHSLLGVCRSGKVLSISICPYRLCQYLARRPASLYLSQRVLQLVGQIS
uniref:Uncharacterized protein n=1 Tax=Sphaerodactylus townsendi TaxID=933632 RepID=A0ACB8EHF2_9SAUR